MSSSSSISSSSSGPLSSSLLLGARSTMPMSSMVPACRGERGGAFETLPWEVGEEEVEAEAGAGRC
jgi:hypothetical protein